MPTALARQRRRAHQAVSARLAEAVGAVQPPGPDGRPLVRASIRAGRVRLRGNVASTARANHIRRAITRVAGLAVVADDLYDDETLARDARALVAVNVPPAITPRVYVVLGKVYLDWPKRDAELERSIEAHISRAAGVRAVVHGQWSQGVWG